MLQQIIPKGIHVTNTSPPLDLHIWAVIYDFNYGNFNSLRYICDKTEKAINKQNENMEHASSLLDVHVVY